MNTPSQQATSSTSWSELVFAWGLGTIAAYFLTGFFSNFYPLLHQFVILGVVFQLAGIGAIALLLHRDSQAREELAPTDWASAAPLGVAFLLCMVALWVVWQFPGLFRREILFMEPARFWLFGVLAVLSLGAILPLRRRLENSGFADRLQRSPWVRFLHSNRQGALLALFFFATYFLFAQSINFPGFRTLDIYFDTDISVWLARLTEPRRAEVSMVRAVHPAILLFLRPVVGLIAFFLAGDRLQAVFVMNALAGAVCVLLAWLIIQWAAGSTTYALIMASVLGASASHLLLSSMFETYIYSALALLFFIVLLQRGHTGLASTVPAGIIVFGITITNIIQTCILYFFQHPRFKVLILYVLLVVGSVLLLNVVQVWFYPSSQSLFEPSSLLYEQRYVSNPLDWTWRTAGRFSLIVRAILLYGIVAPTPFVLMEELGMDVPNFRTYQILLGEFHVAPYRGFADVTVKVWIAILALAGLVFLWKFLRSPRQMVFPLSLLLCIGFSFALHLVYGDDPMLYSPNWVYALVLFVALVFSQWADRRWLQLSMIVFLVMLLYTNLGLLHQILDVSAPFYSVGN